SNSFDGLGIRTRPIPLDEPELRREPRQPRQLAEQFPLSLPKGAAFRALREMDVARGGEETLSPKLQLVRSEVLQQRFGHFSVLRVPGGRGFMPSGPPGKP